MSTWNWKIKPPGPVLKTKKLPEPKIMRTAADLESKTFTTYSKATLGKS